MTQEKNMELFRKALIEARNRKIDDIIREYSDDIIPSVKHEKKMRQILKKDCIHYPIRKKFLIALIAALLALLAGCTIYINRNEIANFYEEIYDKYALVFSPADTNKQTPAFIEQEYTLTYIPDGYQLYSESSTSAGISKIWKNSNNDIIVFDQTAINTFNYFDLEKSDLEIMQINNMQIYYRKFNDFYFYLWVDQIYIYKITCTEAFTEDIIIIIIDNIIEIE